MKIKIILIIIGLVFVFLSYNLISESETIFVDNNHLISESETIFTFFNNDTKEVLNGEVIFDNQSQGYTQQGNLTVPKLKLLPSNIKFIGEDNGNKFEIAYSFPEDYLSYQVVPFAITNEDLEFYKRYYLYNSEDRFSSVLKLHFRNIPITWKIEDPTQCWKKEESKIISAFLEIQNASDNLLIFQQVDSNPDILIRCYMNFTEKYKEFKEELETKKVCDNITFSAEMIGVSNTELNISYKEYKVLAKSVLLSKNKTIWEVCKVKRNQLTFDPDVIFDSNLKLSDYLIGEGGPIESIGNIILKGEARFFGDDKVITSCASGFPLPEVHELLHVLGFSHIIEENELPKDIFGDPINSPEHMSDVLYPYKICLKQTKINDSYASCLKYIYSDGKNGNCSEVNFLGRPKRM